MTRVEDWATGPGRIVWDQGIYRGCQCPEGIHVHAIIESDGSLSVQHPVDWPGFGQWGKATP